MMPEAPARLLLLLGIILAAAVAACSYPAAPPPTPAMEEPTTTTAWAPPPSSTSAPTTTISVPPATSAPTTTSPPPTAPPPPPTTTSLPPSFDAGRASDWLESWPEYHPGDAIVANILRIDAALDAIETSPSEGAARYLCFALLDLGAMLRDLTFEEAGMAEEDRLIPEEERDRFEAATDSFAGYACAFPRQ